MNDTDLLAKWRADTPGCTSRIHLGNAGAALPPASVTRAIKDHIDLEAEIGGYEAADAVAAQVEACYEALAAFLGTKRRNVALTGSATASFIQVLSSFDFKPGDSIVTTKSDYTSYQIQLLALAKRCGVTILHADDLPEGGVDPESVRTLASRPGCRLVTVSWIPTHSGLVQDVAAVGEVCAALGVPFHVDACQAAGQMPIELATLKCDYLTGTARKFLRGPRGMGFLYASDAALARGDHPLFIDMRGATWVSPDRYQVADDARRYEDWESPYALVLGFGAALRYAMEVGADVAQRRAWGHAARLRGSLGALPGVRVLDRGKLRSAIVTADLGSHDPATIAAALRERRINVGVTLRWYGLLDLGPRNITSALRVSPHYYNTDTEIDTFLEHLGELLRT